jgi:hypothetical protein
MNVFEEKKNYIKKKKKRKKNAFYFHKTQTYISHIKRETRKKERMLLQITFFQKETGNRERKEEARTM